MSVITNKWNDGSGDSINIESPSFQGNQTVKISSPVQKGTSKRSMKFIGKCKKDSSKQVILTVEQEASTYTYDLTLNSDNTEIAAKGGTATITAVLKTYRNGNLVSTDNVTPVLSGSATGFSISGTKVTASNRTTTVGSRRSIVVTGKYSNTFDGQTVSSTINIYQEANNKTVKEITNRYVSSNPFTGQNTVKANGGTVKVNTFAIYNYTSGSTSETDVSSECTFTNPQFGTWNSNTHVWTCPSAGTTVYENKRGTSITVKWNDKTTYYYLYQEANVIVSSTPRISIWVGSQPGSSESNPIPASGGRIQYAVMGNTRVVYTSRDYIDNEFTPEISGLSEGFTVDPPSSAAWITADNRGTVIGEIRSITVTASYSGATSKSVTVYQQANSASYGALIGGSVSTSDIPASGGTSSTSISNMSQTISYTSGSTRAGTVTYSKTDEITVSSLGTTVKARTKVGQVTVTYTGEGGATANKTVNIYQSENKVTNSNYNPRITAYGTPTVSIGSGLTAAGGSATVSASVTNTETYNALYSSGAISPNQTRSVSGSLSISMTANGNSRFSLSGNTITHSSMGTNETTDTVTIKAVNNGDSSKSATASKSITNSKTVKSTSGGIYTYGDVIAGTVTNGIIPASGGSATAKAGNATQSWNKSATITTYQYDSGSTKDVTTENASSGTNSVPPSTTSIEASAPSKGTTISPQTTVRTYGFIWAANGKSADGYMYIYQEANKIESYNYGSWTIAISANPTTIAASGGTSTITASCTRTKTPVYTSGSTGTATTESATPTLAISGTGFTLSGTTVTASKNNVAARTAIVTASYSGATSKSVTITQSAGPDGIGYMEIEGDGTNHPIFRVGGATRSVEPMSINETSETASDEDVSIFASIKKFLTKFV